MKDDSDINMGCEPALKIVYDRYEYGFEPTLIARVWWYIGSWTHVLKLNTSDDNLG